MSLSTINSKFGVHQFTETFEKFLCKSESLQPSLHHAIKNAYYPVFKQFTVRIPSLPQVTSEPFVHDIVCAREGEPGGTVLVEPDSSIDDDTPIKWWDIKGKFEECLTHHIELMRHHKALCHTGYINLHASSRVWRLSNTTHIHPVVPKILCNRSDHQHVQGLPLNPKRGLHEHIYHPHHPHCPKLPPCSHVQERDWPLVDMQKCAEKVTGVFLESVCLPPWFFPSSLPRYYQRQCSMIAGAMEGSDVLPKSNLVQMHIVPFDFSSMLYVDWQNESSPMMCYTTLQSLHRFQSILY